MLLRNQRRRKHAIIIGLVGLMLVLATAVSPALAHTIFLDRFRADPQSVTVQDMTGTHRGILHADLKGLADGSASGPISLEVGDKYYEFDFNEVTEIRLSQGGRPNGISLKGTGTMTEDDVMIQLLNLQASVELEGDDDVSDPIYEIVDDCIDMTVIGEAVNITFGGQ